MFNVNEKNFDVMFRKTLFKKIMKKTWWYDKM